MSLAWRGDQVRSHVERAVLAGMDETMAACVLQAKGLVRVKTAVLQGSIQMRPAEFRGAVAIGLWGSFDVNYAIWQEIGTSRMTGKPYLRPSADAQYPRLGARIKARLAA